MTRAEKREYAKLRKEIECIAIGARVDRDISDDGKVSFIFSGSTEFGRFISALYEKYGNSTTEPYFKFPWFSEYESLDDLANLFFRHGVRAND